MKATIVQNEVKIAIYTVYVPSDADPGGASTIRRQLLHSADARKPGVPWKMQLYEDLDKEV